MFWGLQDFRMTLFQLKKRTFFFILLLSLLNISTSNADVPTAGDERLAPAAETATTAPQPQGLQTERAIAHQQESQKIQDDPCHGTGTITKKVANIPAPNGSIISTYQCCGDGSNCKCIETHLQPLKLILNEYKKCGDAPPPCEAAVTLTRYDATGAVHYDLKSLLAELPPTAPVEPISTTTPPKNLKEALTVAEKEYKGTVSDRTSTEKSTQSQTAEAESARVSSVQQNTQSQQAALLNAQPSELPSVAAQIASTNQQMINANNACNVAFQNANSICSSANDTNISFPQNVSGGRNAMLVAESQCQRAAQTFQSSSNRCQEAISNCGSVCASAGRTCNVFSAYSTSAMIRSDSATYCSDRARITINQIDGKNLLEGTSLAMKYSDKDSETAGKRKSKKDLEDESDEESPSKNGKTNNLIANDNGSAQTTAVTAASVDREKDKDKDLKEEQKKISTGTIDEGGTIQASANYSSSRKERKSNLAESNNSRPESNIKNNAEDSGGTLSARELIARISKRAPASVQSGDFVSDRNPNHDVFYGASRAHFIWQQKHAHIPVFSTPSFYFKENQPSFIESGWQEE